MTSRAPLTREQASENLTILLSILALVILGPATLTVIGHGSWLAVIPGATTIATAIGLWRSLRARERSA